jgi:rubrerythrin
LILYLTEKDRKEEEMKKRPADVSKNLVKVLKDWQKLEDESINHADATMKKTRNKLVKMTMEMIKNDSQKHRVMQQFLIDSLTRESPVLAPEDLADLADGLNKHLAAEAKTLELADKALQHSELFITRYILSYLIADEQKHHALLSKLSELKRATVFVT